MRQPHPPHQIVRNLENIPQHINLKLVKRPIDRGLKQRLQLMQPILNLQPRLGVLDVSVLVCIGDRVCGGCVLETEAFGRRV